MAKLLLAFLAGAVLSGSASNPQEGVRASATHSSLTLHFDGPSQVRLSDHPQFRAFLINESNQNIEVPSAESVRDVVYLQWRAVNASNGAVKSQWAGYTVCSFGKKFTQQVFLVLKAGQRMELSDIHFPDRLVASASDGNYRISIRYAFPHPGVVLLADDFARSKIPIDVSSNELAILFAK